MAGIVDQRDHRLDVLGRPVARHQGFAGGIGIGRGPDHADDLVDIGHRDGETDQDMGAVAGLVEQELGAARHHLFAEGDEQRQQVLQVHRLRAAGVQRQHVGGKIGLQRREPVELVQHHIRHGVALQFDHHAKTVAVGFVAQIGDALDLLLAVQFGNARDHGGLVHLVGNFGDDDGFAVLADGVDRHLAAHHDRAAAEMIGRADALAAEDDAAGGKIRSGNDVDEVVDAERGIVDQRDAGVDDFAEIVRRDVGRHADRDAAGAVDQKVRKFRRQNRRFALGIVVVRPGNRRCPCRYRREPRAPIASDALRCIDRPPADRRRPSRNCPDRRSAARAWRNPAPSGPSRRKSTGRRADDIYRSRRRRRART